MSNNLSVKVTAEVADLQAKFAVAKAEVNGLSSEMNKLAKQSAAGVLDSAGQAQLQQVAEDFLHAKAAAAELSAELKKNSESFKEVGESAGGIGGALEEIRGKMSSAFEVTGIAVAAEGIKMFGEAIEKLGERATQMHAMSEVLGVTSAQFQTMQVAAEEGGTSIEVFSRAGEKLLNVLTEARAGSGAAVEKLLDLGITTEQIADPAFKLNEILATLRDRLNDSGTAEQTRAQLLKELGPRAALAAEAIKAYDGSNANTAETVARLNGLSDEQIKQLHELHTWWGELGTTVANTTSKFLLALTPMDDLLAKQRELAQFKASGASEAQVNALQDRLGLGSMGGATEDGWGEGKDDAAQASARAQEDLQREILKQEMDNAKAGVEAFKQGTEEKLSALKTYAAAARAYYGSDQVDAVVKANQAVISEQRAVNESQKSGLQELTDFTKQMDNEIAADRERLALQSAKIDAEYTKEVKKQQEELFDGWAKEYTQITTMHANMLKQQAALDAQAAKDQARAWQPFTQALTSGLDNSLKKMLEGTTSFSNGMRSIFASAADGIVGSFAKMAAKNISTMLQQAVVGDTMRAKEIQKDAGAGAAAAYKAIAGIPYVGPILAPAAAAVAYAGIMAFDSAEGGYDIPAGRNPMTQLHEREMVLPRAQADVIRGLAGSGGDGGGGGDIHNHVHLNVSAWDSRSVSQFINDPATWRMIQRKLGSFQ